MARDVEALYQKVCDALAGLAGKASGFHTYSKGFLATRGLNPKPLNPKPL